MTKPSATTAQINALIEKLDDACLGKTPFTCADGTCSDRLFTQQTNIIHDFFTYSKEDHEMNDIKFTYKELNALYDFCQERTDELGRGNWTAVRTETGFLKGIQSKLVICMDLAEEEDEE